MDNTPKPRFSPADLDAAPKIVIAGKEWPIPVFGPRQNRRIVPHIGRLSGMDPTAMTTDDMDNLYNIIFWALNRAHPEVNEKDFMDWEIPLNEALRAIPVIAKQTGMMSFGKTGEMPDQLGNGETAPVTTEQPIQ